MPVTRISAALNEKAYTGSKITVRLSSTVIAMISPTTLPMI